MELLIKHDRLDLVEGRKCGIGFGFCKEVGKNIFETIMPISPCKDYLHEVVFTENTGFPTKAYGFKHEKINVFDNKSKFVYLAIKICKKLDGTYLYHKNSFAEDCLNLKKNYKNVQKGINFIENLLNIENSKITICKDENSYIIKFSKKWINSTHSVSLYTFLIRVLQYYKDGDVLEFLKDISNYSELEEDLQINIIPKLELIIKSKILPEQCAFDKDLVSAGVWTPHNFGIAAFKIEDLQ